MRALNKKYIQNFRFKFEKQERDTVFMFNRTIKNFRHRGAALVVLTHNTSSNWICIEVDLYQFGVTFKFEDTQTIFSGTIKTKREFNRLLKQLMIK